MKKISYRSRRPISNKPIKPCDLPSTPKADEAAGAGAYGYTALGEPVHPATHTEQEEAPLYETDSVSRRPHNRIDLARLTELLLGIADGMDEQGDIALANFTDFLINKVAAQRGEDYSALFRGLLMKIADSDILDKDKLLTESTLTFNRILVAEVANGVPIGEAKRSAFNIVMSKVADDVD